MGFFRRYRTAIVLGASIAFAAGALSIAYLTSVVTSRFNGRRWNLPSRIYSDVETLAPGLELTPDALVEKLGRLYYAPVDGAPEHAGQYHAAKNAVEVWLHSFSDIGRRFEGFPVRIDFAAGKIRSITTLDGDQVSSVVVEPELLGSVFDKKLEDRTLVRLSDVSKPLIDAILTREDRDFYRHGGVSLRRIAAALVNDVRHGSASQGGSTLTQQLVKNLYLSPRRTIKRKVVEAMMAVILDASYSKEEILQAYLNEIYLGQRGAISITGVGEASRYYFGKNVSDLDVAESAALAGMIASPGRFNPFRYPERCRARRDALLRMMLDAGRIDRDQFDRAAAEPLTPSTRPPARVQAPHFVNFVENQLQEKYGEKLGTEGLQIFTTLDVDLQQRAQKSVTDGLANLEKTYRRLRIASAHGPLQGALIVIDPGTGAVKALVGGRDYALSQFNRVTQAHRQPGSLFKPFVYLAAFSRRDLPEPITPASILLDAPITLVWGKGEENERWTPHNDDNQYRGPISARRALEMSVNVPTVRVAVRTGLDTVVAAARAAGISSRLRGYPSLALGAFEISPMEIASAYCALADEGVRVEPNAIAGVTDASGKILERRETPLKRVLPPDAVFLVDSLMQGVVNRGTGGGVRSRGVRGVLAGKTGTTNDGRDAWFIGFSPKILAAVWVGFDDNRGLNLSGSQAAVPIFADFIKGVPSNLLSETFPAPADIVTAEIDPETGMLVTPFCPQTMTEVFLSGTAPVRYCTVHAPMPEASIAPGEPPGSP
ncbi:MAG TPA: PBP1A family penicillin-binding protein [Thermoanaerobaculia bacterium]|nr:PBP1A family penicillin-binding protein [Thermoanaerobaculia bacterium]